MMKKELKERYKELVGAYWKKDPKMVDYLMKRYCVLFEIDGGIAEIDKPSIKTNFCFGYHLNKYDTESFDDAKDMASYARKSVEYFKNENLRVFNDWIDELTKVKEKMTSTVVCVSSRYCGISSGLKGICFMKRWDLDEPYNAKWRELTAEEIDVVIEAYKKAKELFEKRLNTYLKRYGLSKVETWTYWADE